MASRKKSGCPLCGKPVQPAIAPFCSTGCKDRDLLQWLGDGYRVPGPPVLLDEVENAVASRSGHDDGN